jgi:hypothetical protein
VHICRLILKKKGQYEQAKPLYLDALKIVEQVYGEVTESLRSFETLARLRGSRGLTLQEHVLVAEISNNLADVYRKIALVDQATGALLLVLYAPA